MERRSATRKAKYSDFARVDVPVRCAEAHESDGSLRIFERGPTNISRVAISRCRAVIRDLRIVVRVSCWRSAANAPDENQNEATTYAGLPDLSSSARPMSKPSGPRM
jgi:hypothetical protein